VLAMFGHSVTLAQGTDPITVAIWCGIAFVGMLFLFLVIAILKYGVPS